MKKILVAALALVMLVTACSAMADTYKLGFIGPLTGPAADYGNSARVGAEVAVAEINAMGGDIQFELNSQDDEHDAEKSVNAYNNLLDWGAQAIVGTVTTTPCIAVGTEANNDRVFMLTPSASSTAVIEGKDNVFQVCFTDPAQGAASAQYIADHQLATKVGIIYNNADAYSTGIYQTFIEKAAELNLEVAATSTFTDDTTDFSVQVTAMKEAGADLVFLPIYYTPASMILQQAKAQDFAPIFFGVDGMDGILSIEGFDTSLAEGVMLLTPFSADAQDERTQKFVEAYTAIYGAVPSQFAADAYDCVFAFKAAIEATGLKGDVAVEDACEAFISVFPTMTVEGLTGTMTWTATGEVTKTPTAVVIKDGVYVGAN